MHSITRFLFKYHIWLESTLMLSMADTRPVPGNHRFTSDHSHTKSGAGVSRRHHQIGFVIVVAVVDPVLVVSGGQSCDVEGHPRPESFRLRKSSINKCSSSELESLTGCVSHSNYFLYWHSLPPWGHVRGDFAGS